MSFRILGAMIKCWLLILHSFVELQANFEFFISCALIRNKSSRLLFDHIYLINSNVPAKFVRQHGSISNQSEAASTMSVHITISSEWK